MSIPSDRQKTKPDELFPEVPASSETTSAANSAVPFSILTSDRALSKRFGIADGRPVKLASDATLISGRATRRALTGSTNEQVAQLAAELNSLSSSNALVCAPPPSGREEWRVLTQKEAGGRTDVISRTKDHFVPQAGLALMGLDFDIKDYPEFIKARLLAMGTPNISAVLAKAYPPFDLAASVARASMSAGVRVRATGNETNRNGGLHRFFIVDDGRRVEGFAANLRDHLMLDGWLWGHVSKSGSILFRTLFDVTASGDTSRLWYEGRPVLESEELEFLPERREATATDGAVLNISGLGALTPEQQDRLSAMKDEVRLSLAEVAKQAHSEWSSTIRARVPASASPFGLTRALENAIVGNVLQGSFPIALDDGRTVTAREILADPQSFNGATCPDPIEPDYNGGRNIAIIFSDGAGPVRIESLAHGGARYTIGIAVEDYFEPIEDPAAPKPDTELKPRDIFRDGDVDGAVLEVPRGALPGVIERWSVDIGERIGAPPAFPAVAALATAAGAIGSKLKIQPRQHDTGWVEPAFLWVGIVESPGGRKTPVIAQATAPLSRLDAQKAKEGGEAWAQWNERKRQAKRGQPWTEPEPKIRRHVVDNFTVEALTGVLADNPSGVLVSVDELTGLIGSLDAYKSNRGGDRPMLLRLFDGRENRVDRVGRKHTHIECWGAAVVGGVQPKKIIEMAPDLDADGLLQRILPVWGDGVRRQGIDRAPDRAALDAYDSAIRRLAGAEFAFPEPITLSAEAHEVWRGVSDRLSVLAALPGLSDAWAGHLGKWPGFSARLLLISHVFANLERLEEVDQHPVSEATAIQASKLVDWLLANSIRFYVECIGAGEAGDDAKWIAGYILSSSHDGQLTRREIGRSRRELRDDPARLGRAMRFLEHSEWCVADTSERMDRFGPSRWTISPAVHDGRFADRAAQESKRRAAERARIEAAVSERRRLLQESENDQD